MKKIKEYVEGIADELCGAKDYAEKSLWYKAKGSPRYATYKAMAQTELDHAEKLHQMAVEDIEELKRVYPEVPQEMEDAWVKSHKDFVEKVAWIKQMMAM